MDLKPQLAVGLRWRSHRRNPQQTSVGGFIGRNSGTITSGAFDNETSGQSSAFGLDAANQGANVAGLTTAQLQRAGLPTGFDPIVWAGGTSGLYPYIQSFFPGGVEAISGTAQSAGGAAAVGGQVAIYADGTLLGGGSASVGANGYYYVAVAAGTFVSAGNKIGATLTLAGASGVGGLTYTDGAGLAGSGLDLGVVSSGLIGQTTAQASYSALQSDLGATFGDGNYAGLTTALGSAVTRLTVTGASFTLDQAVTTGADYSLVSTGAGAPLTIGAAGRITSSGAILIAVNGNFLNNAGASALSPGTSFTIYTQNAANPTGTPPTNNFGGLTATSSYDNAYDFAAGTFAKPVPVGNAFVYAYPASLPPTGTGSTDLIWASNTVGLLTSTTTYSAPGFEMTVTPSLDSGVLYADPRFDRILVCFSSGCYSVN